MGILNYKIELPTEEVAKEFTEIGHSWWRDSPFFKQTGIELVYDHEYAKTFIYHHSILLVGRDTEGKMGAFYLASIIPYTFNPSKLAAYEIVWNIREDLQGTGVFGELLEEIESTLDSIGVDVYNLVLHNEKKFDTACDGLLKRGFQLQDRVFVKSRKV